MVHFCLIIMKNLFFSLAIMLIGSLALANNPSQFDLSEFQKTCLEKHDVVEMQSNQNLFGTCTVPIAAYDEDGNKIKTWLLVFENVDSAKDCDDIVTMVEEVLSSMTN